MDKEVIDMSTQCIVIIYIRYWSSVDFLQWDIESNSKLDYERADTPMGPNGLHFELICLVVIGYDGWIDSKFTFMYKSVLLIT